MKILAKNANRQFEGRRRATRSRHVGHRLGHQSFRKRNPNRDATTRRTWQNMSQSLFGISVKPKKQM
ncbi:Uncharacterized protein APZ42_034365 [Daphnia magna]|uniref:Uncharacterized protein n=1 Tax=Daphnia magna TaxID=35525 RepID=A0A164K444_9CRUS|nr:Uncharacterized protein APZ42_034365 [Daphnia magna]